MVSERLVAVAFVVLALLCFGAFLHFAPKTTSAYSGLSTGAASGPSGNFAGFFGPASAHDGLITFSQTQMNNVTINNVTFNMSAANNTPISINSNTSFRSRYITQLAVSQNFTTSIDTFLEYCSNVNETSNSTTINCTVNWTPRYELLVGNVTPAVVDFSNQPIRLALGTAARVRIANALNNATEVSVNLIDQNVTD